MSELDQLTKDQNEYDETVGPLMSDFNTIQQKIRSLSNNLMKHQQMIADFQGVSYAEEVVKLANQLEFVSDAFANLVEGVLPQC